MSIRDKKMDGRYRLMERCREAEFQEAVAESLFEAFRIGRLMPVRATTPAAFHWPAPPGER
jgi:hypothetical protein